jgi:hypothetical protein
MQKKLTITLDEAVYDGLHRVIGRRRISRFIEELVRAHILAHELEGTMSRGRAGGRRGYRAALPRRLVVWRRLRGGVHELDQSGFLKEGHAHARWSATCAASTLA